MSNLTIKDLIPGEIYFHHSSSDCKYIIIAKEDKNNPDRVSGDYYYSYYSQSFGSYYLNSTIQELRLATFEERELLLSGLKKDYPDFIYKEIQNIENYDIY